MDHPSVTNIQRITLLNVPLDIVPQDQISRIAREFAEDDHHKHIIFPDLRQIHEGSPDLEFLTQLNRATLVIPVSKSLELDAGSSSWPRLVRHYPFDFTIKFLGALEEKKRTIYLLGEHHEGIQMIAANMRTSFPGLTLIGRHTGHYGKDKEEPHPQSDSESHANGPTDWSRGSRTGKVGVSPKFSSACQNHPSLGRRLPDHGRTQEASVEGSVSKRNLRTQPITVQSSPIDPCFLVHRLWIVAFNSKIAEKG